MQKKSFSYKNAEKNLMRKKTYPIKIAQILSQEHEIAF